MKKGFTLIELLVVVAIISILTIISVSQFNTAKIKARDTQRKADIDSVAKALDSYYADYGEFPAEIEWGGTLMDVNEGAEPYYYMRVVPEENYLDMPYCYVVDINNGAYGLFARMEGEGLITGSFTVPTCPAGSGDYNYGRFSPNTNVNSFCNGSLCTAVTP
ncbi:MAG: Type II secretion system protein G precursor [Firmicutes bacterium ADurb.Bin419]|nr:MAG: Type II secretion system protein G precursor [Firmicutes bacterium ADurb.Bin419]